MKEEVYKTKDYVDLKGARHTLRYCIILEPEGFGVAIRDSTGEAAVVRDLTTRRSRAEEVLALLERNLVTPVTLRDVIEDLL